MDFQTLLQQPESQRDDRWELQFLDAVIPQKVQLESDQAKTGPDGWPYMFVRTGPEGQEPLVKIVTWLAGRGIGLVVNAHKMLPDYVFPYGMLWNFTETGLFLRPPNKNQKPGEKVDAIYAENGQKVITGPPSEKYLPPYVRSILVEFLRAQGFAAPKVLVVSSADFREVDLLISTDSLPGLEAKDHQKMADRLAWFLPMHYNLVLAREEGLPPFSIL